MSEDQNPDGHHPEPATSNQHSYYDWQLATLMYAYDVALPLEGSDQNALATRMQSCEHELYRLAKTVIPDGYWQEQQLQLSPEVVMRLTQATVLRAAEIMKLVSEVPLDEPI